LLILCLKSIGCGSASQKWIRIQDLHQREKRDPNMHQRDADPQHSLGLRIRIRMDPH
jgi:hypothetical protein